MALELATFSRARERWTALPPLKLRGAGTSLVESLPSFVSRLLATTGLTGVHFAERLGVEFAVELRRVGAFLKVNDPVRAENTVRQLERLTGARNLRCGTFWALASILTAGNQDNSKKSRRRWCPACYGEWSVESYEPLAWSVDLLQACPKHGCLLIDSCPSCGRHQGHRMSELRRRFCHACGTDLSASVTWPTPHPFLEWVDRQVLELIEVCAIPRSAPVPHDVLREFVEGLHRRMGGRRGGALGHQMKLYAAGTRLRRQRTSMRSLINLCAVQGISVSELLAAPRETSGPLLFDSWGGLSYLPLPTPRQAQKIYVASRCLMDLLHVRRRQYLPPLFMLLGRFKVQLLAVRDVAPEAYDLYMAKQSAQGAPAIQKKLRIAYTASIEVLSESASEALPELASEARVMSKAKVSYRTAMRAVQSASLVSDTLADGVIKAYEDEMPITAAVEWFVRNRRCSWSGTRGQNRRPA